MRTLGILVGLVVMAATAAAIPEPVKIETGLISGSSAAKGDMRFFKGIPYAAPPVGPLRWKPPQPAAHWGGVRKAETFGPRCMQGGTGTSEDCLTLNVWTAAAAASERRPVILFVFGGALTGGAGSEARYDGEALARKGVVFVTFNYRLGVFGFLAHPELTKESGHNASGNYGFMDTIAALRWIQKNIRAFGGDPGRVTLMGESAGANIIANLTASPEAKGLFHRVIAESGSWMGPNIARTMTLAQAEENGVAVAKAMNAASLSELRAKSAEELQRSSGFTPKIIIDGWIVPEDASNIYSQGKQNAVDILAGSNKDEATFFAGRGGSGGGSDPARINDEFHWVLRNWANLQSKRGKSKAYLFFFTRVPPGNGARGATHGAELPYAFGNLIGNTAWTDVDRQLADTMTSYWVNFAANGDPNAAGLPMWPAFKEKTNDKAMLLGDKLEVGTGIDAARVAFFDDIYAKLFMK